MIVRLYFGPDTSGGVQIYGYGACTPTPCEWGATPVYLLVYPGEADPEWGLAIWQFEGGYMNVIVFHLEGEEMIVQTYTAQPPNGGVVATEILQFVP